MFISNIFKQIKFWFERFVIVVCASDMKELKNIHQGETCYIFGGGMSIKEMDMTKFSEYPAIATNMFVLHKDFSSLDIRYVTIVEPWYFAPEKLKPTYARRLREVVGLYKKIIKNHPSITFIVSLSNKLFFNNQNLRYVFRGYPNPSDDDRALMKFDLFNGAFRASISLASYLGFKRIILVGFDGFTIQPPMKGTFYEFGAGRHFNANNFEESFLDIIKRKSDVYTIGINGKSSTCKYIEYSQYTEVDPVYKENSDLIDRVELDIITKGYQGYYESANLYYTRAKQAFLQKLIDFFTSA